MVIAAEKELKDTKAQIKTFNRQSRQAENLEQQREIQEKIKQLERKKRRQRQQIFDIEDEIMEKRDKLIDALEKRLEQKTAVDELFTIRWAVI
jgi:predicted  nucleic acid-binding Zn-ribbon protein